MSTDLIRFKPENGHHAVSFMPKTGRIALTSGGYIQDTITGDLDDFDTVVNNLKAEYKGITASDNPPVGDLAFVTRVLTL